MSVRREAEIIRGEGFFIMAFTTVLLIEIQRSYASNRQARKNNLQRIEKTNGLDRLGS
jgi:hypothetical protein